MTHAVLFAAARSPQAGVNPVLLPLGDRTVVSRVRDQLATLGAEQVVVLARPEDAGPLREAGLAVVECGGPRDELLAVERVAKEAAGRALVLCAADLVAADTAVSAVVAAGAHRDAALVGRPDSGSPAADVVVQRGRVVHVGPGATAANAEFRGLVAADPHRVADVVAALLDGCEDPQPDPLTAVLTGLVDGDAPVAAVRVPGLPYRRVSTAGEAGGVVAELERVDEDAVRLRLAVKAQDDLFATYAVSSYSPHLVRWAARWGLTPTAVTWLSVAVAVLSAAAFAQGSRGLLVAGAVGLYVSFVLDCVDGQLARYRHRYSSFGGWLDTIADRGKEYLVYAGLATGAARSGAGDIWPLAIAAMVLLTVRHMTDTWYGTLQDEAALVRARAGSTTPGSLSVRLGATLGAVSDRVLANQASPMYWVKRTIPLPIGERWMLIALTTALFGARVALLALLVWGGVAAAYTLVGRTLRSRALRVPVMRTVDPALHRDDGVLARALGTLGRGTVPPLAVSVLPALLVLASVVPGVRPWSGYLLVAAYLAAAVAGLAAGHHHEGPLHWLVPAALRGSEYALVLAVGDHAGVPLPLLFALLGVLALYHYDLTARLERRGSPLLWRSLGLGWDGRLALLGLGTLFGVGAQAVAALTTYLVVIFVGGALLGLTLPAARQRPALPRQRRGGVPLATPVGAGGPTERT